MAPLAHLYFIDISNCKELSPCSITDLCATNRNLLTLKMSNCKRAVNDEALTFVARSLKSLQVIDIMYCSEITDVGLQAFDDQEEKL